MIYKFSIWQWLFNKTPTNPMHSSMPNQWKLVKTNWAVGVVNSLTVSCIAWMSARACSLPSALKRVTHDIRRDSSSATVSTICVSTRDTRLGDTLCTCKIKYLKNDAITSHSKQLHIKIKTRITDTTTNFTQPTNLSQNHFAIIWTTFLPYLLVIKNKMITLSLVKPGF